MHIAYHRLEQKATLLCYMKSFEQPTLDLGAFVTNALGDQQALQILKLLSWKRLSSLTKDEDPGRIYAALDCERMECCS